MISVLYVDDEPSLLEICTLFLERGGDISVDTALSAGDAIERMASHHYDAVISDYQMPGMDGIEFLRTVRESGDGIPFIIFTGKGREEVVIEALNCGADFYLQKGGDPKSQFAELKSKILHSTARKRAEEAQRESEERLRTLIGAMPDIVCFKDGEGRWLEANEFTLGLLGLGEGEYRGKTDADLADLSPLYRHALQNCERIDHAAWGAGKPVRKDEAIPRPDGTPMIFDFIKVPTYHPDGTRKGLIVIGRDVTERSRAECAIRESEEKYRTLVEEIRDGFFMTDHSGTITFATQTLANIFGCDAPAEMAGQSFSRWVSPEQRKWAVSAFTSGIETGKMSETPIEVPVVREDGTLAWTEIKTYPIIRNGTTEGARGIVRDITARKQASIALAESEEIFHAVTNAAIDGIIMIDDRGCITFWNPAAERIFGYSAGEAIGRNVHDLIAPGHRHATIREGFRHFSATGIGPVIGRTLRLEAVRKSGEDFPIELSVSAVRMRDGWHAVGIVRDVSERVQG
ncbi:PAS domain S-box protein [Methanofollis fontis]|uniref:PAS domain S-box protein n=1 Tax=Methanofollis fontis TaxID=2052832 RepID=A0A483CTE0_9EURY|nr:PAS domain S-box protein [Methanofollis fontis]TAJ45624.1 hypothetical protein CUJ86_02570 [Methanofollis fontis]